ncbi:hypothetical protein [Aeromonas phage ZPAH34]|uniref:hypothetical protein n=1 Tax=Aeromonas phage ZPAH34 TaxID=2924888 RepID=UPI0023297279|nr:hypothetical protein PQD16_gp144 [Aeromonas phage ZPAH34]UOX39539.1 hypothetical protein [Aeromonas phage ZPAH34]
MSYIKLALNCSDRRVRMIIIKENTVEALKEVVKSNYPDFYFSGNPEPIEKDWKLPSERFQCHYSLELGFSMLCFGLSAVPAGNFPGFSKTKPLIQKYAAMTEIAELFYQAETQFFNSTKVSGVDFVFTGEVPEETGVGISQVQLVEIVKLFNQNNCSLSEEQFKVLNSIVK